MSALSASGLSVYVREIVNKIVNTNLVRHEIKKRKK